MQLFKNIDNNGSPIFDDGDGMRTVSYEAYGSNSSACGHKTGHAVASACLIQVVLTHR